MPFFLPLVSPIIAAAAGTLPEAATAAVGKLLVGTAAGGAGAAGVAPVAGGVTNAATAGLIGSGGAVSSSAMAGIGLAGSALGTAGQFANARQAKQVQEQQNRIQKRTAHIQRKQQIRNAINEQRFGLAQQEVQAGASGISSSSAFAGASSSIKTQGAVIGSEFSSQEKLNKAFNTGQNTLSDLNASSNIFAAVGNLGKTVFSDSGGSKNLFFGANNNIHTRADSIFA